MIPQMIIFFSLFYVLRAIAEWKPGQAPKYGLTVPVLESAQKATIFGVHLYDKLLFPHTTGMGLTASIVAAITVTLSATTTFMTVRQSSKRGLMQTNVDPDNPMAQSQKYMMYIVPFFSLTGLYWQYGLVLYWVTTNLWTLGQQYFMFRNWTTEPALAASATAAAAGGPARAAQSATRSASGAAKASPGAAKSTPSSAKTAPGTAKTAPAGPRPATGSGRPAAGAPRAKTGSGSGSTATAAADRVQTGSAARDAAANASGPPNGQNGAAKRGLLRLGRPKPEPVPEPEVPATKVVRQQPVRQAKSKRSGKR